MFSIPVAKLVCRSGQESSQSSVDFELDVRRDSVCHDQLTVTASTVSGSDHVIFSDCGALGKQVTAIVSASYMRVCFSSVSDKSRMPVVATPQ